MVVNDLLRPRQEVIDPEVTFQHAVRAYRVKDDEDRLESNPDRFFATTYPSNAIRNMIKITNQKLTGVDNQGGIVLSGAYGSGKSHALITLYNIFTYPGKAQKWINYHNVKFNLATIKDNSKSCILSTSEVDPDRLWEPIMEELDKQEMISKIDRYPTIDDIEELVGNEYTAIFIDELERWFGSFNPEQEDHLIEANKMFIQNILEVAADNEKLFVFIGFLEENKELKEIINRSKPRKEDMAATGDKERIIIHRLFETSKEEVDKNKVEQIVDDYLAEYENVELDFENRQKYRAEMIDSYPFHPELLSVLDDIYDEASRENQNVRGELQILVDVVKKKYLDKDMFLISDLDGRALQGIDYHIIGRFRSDIRVCREHNIEYSKEILTSILLYTLDSKRGVAEKEEVFLATIRPEEVSGIDIDIGIGELIGTAHYLHKEESGYLFKDQRNVFALIKSNAEKIKDEKKVKKELAHYIKDELFDKRYKIYGYDEIEDNSKVKYVLLLDAPHEREGLEEFVNQGIYHGRQYRNTLAIIKPNRDVFTDKFTTKMKRIMAARQLKEELNEGEDKIVETLEGEEEELTRELKESFGRYLRWASSGDQIKIRQEVVEADHDAVREKIRTDKSAVKDYIITEVKGQETGRVIEDLLADCKKYRKNPFVSNDSDFTNAVKELYNDKRIYLEGDNNKIYRGERVSVQSRWAILDPEYHPEVAEEPSDEIENDNDDINGADQVVEEDNTQLTLGGSDGSEEINQVTETEPVELSVQGNSSRLLISQIEAQLRSSDQINKIEIAINFGEEFTKEELRELLLQLPDKEGSYSLEVRGERECD